jgi:F0F1-type ATP synthase delta subunit
MRVHDYSEAVRTLVREGFSLDAALDGLRTMLTTRGHSRLYPKILKELLTESIKDEVRDTATVTVARKGDAEAHEKEIKTHLTTLSQKHHTVVVDESIVGGYIVEGTNARIDNSYKKRLLTLYRSLIKS